MASGCAAGYHLHVQVSTGILTFGSNRFMSNQATYSCMRARLLGTFVLRILLLAPVCMPCCRGGNGLDLEENCLYTHYKRMCTLYMLWEEHMPCLQVSVHAQTYVLST